MGNPNREETRNKRIRHRAGDAGFPPSMIAASRWLYGDSCTGARAASPLWEVVRIMTAARAGSRTDAPVIAVGDLHRRRVPPQRLSSCRCDCARLPLRDLVYNYEYTFLLLAFPSSRRCSNTTSTIALPMSAPVHASQLTLTRMRAR